MPFQKNYEWKDEFAGHQVVAEFETMPGEAENLIRDLVRRDRFADAEITAVVSALRKLYVDEKLLFKNTRQGARRVQGNEMMHLPPARDYMDPDTMESLTDALLKRVVKHEFWLAKKDPFDECFDRYLDEEDDEGPATNPTPVPIKKSEKS
jgi:hypothetical protein